MRVSSVLLGIGLSVIVTGGQLAIAATLQKPANWGTPDQPWGTRRPVTSADKALIAQYRASKTQAALSTDFKDAAEFTAGWQKISDDKAGLLSCRRPANVETGADGLVLKTSISIDCKSAKWSTGYAISNFKQKYGFFETSMKIASVNGMNNAFWLTTPDAYEIDVAEVRYPNYVHMNLCNWAPSVKDHTVGIGANFKEDLSAAYHDYGVLWTPKEIIFEIDGEPIGVIMTAESISGPADVRYSTGLADWAGSVNSSPQGHDFDAKWLHVLAYSP